MASFEKEHGSDDVRNFQPGELIQITHGSGRIVGVFEEAQTVHAAEGLRQLVFVNCNGTSRAYFTDNVSIARAPEGTPITEFGNANPDIPTNPPFQHGTPAEQGDFGPIIRTNPDDDRKPDQGSDEILALIAEKILQDNADALHRFQLRPNQ
jgi:hypothetical protein